jgi:hypothetical protein
MLVSRVTLGLRREWRGSCETERIRTRPAEMSRKPPRSRGAIVREA